MSDADSDTLMRFHALAGFRHPLPASRYAELLPELARLNTADQPMRQAGVVPEDPWAFAVFQREAARGGSE
jgi:hypothetical protein